MPEAHDVVIKVISQKGICHAGHKVGDEWVVSRGTPAGICLGAFHTLYPSLFTLIIGAQMWGADPDASVIACPDSKNPVFFEMKRKPKAK